MLRSLFALALAFALSPSSEARVMRGSSASTSRIVIFAYGQSNMDTFFNGSSSGAAANTYVWNGSTLATASSLSATISQALVNTMNTLTTATGLPVVSMNCAQGGSSLINLASGADYNACVTLGTSLPISSTDQMFFIWDQGEGDAINSPPNKPDYYAPTLATLHSNLASAFGKTTATAPWISAGKGSASPTPLGDWSGGTTPLSWHIMTQSLAAGPSYDPNMYWFSQYDFVRTDGYHYYFPWSGVEGVRFARYITNLLGKTSGAPVFPINSAAVVDATHTTVTVTQGLGTDWTPTTASTGTDGFEVSGDNGVTWNNVSHSHISATQISLTHTSLTTTNARLVRYLYGDTPPDVVFGCNTPAVPPGCTPPTNMILDNSALSVPLSPTTWNLRAAGLSTLPMPTWRDVVTLTGSGAVQTASGIQLGSDGVQQFVVMALVGPTLQGAGSTTVSSIVIQPQDFLGNNVGSSVTLTTPTPAAVVDTVSIFSASLNLNNAGATTFSVTVTYAASPFTNTQFNIWTVPLSTLSSTTPTGSGAVKTTSSLTSATTLNTSSGGFVIAAASNSVQPQTGSGTFTFTGTETYGVRWVGPTGQPYMIGDAANTGANASSSVTATFNVSGTTDIAVASWR